MSALAPEKQKPTGVRQYLRHTVRKRNPTDQEHGRDGEGGAPVLDLAATFVQIRCHRARQARNGEASQQSSDDHLFHAVGAALNQSTDHSHSVPHEDSAPSSNLHGKSGNEDTGDKGSEIVAVRDL